MRALAQLYIQQFRTTFASMLQYRASLLIWLIGQVLEPLIYLIVWSQVSANSGGSIGSYSTSDFASYFIVLMVVNQVTYTWIMYEFEYRVREGYLSFALLKPVHPIHSDIAANVSSKLITLPIMILIAVALAATFHASIISLTPWAVAIFIPALLLAFLVRFLLEWTIAQTAFWTTRISAVNQTYFVVMLFLSGQIAPLALLPHAVQILSMILPFRWLISFPVELLLGRLTLVEALIGLAAQAAWLIASLVLVRIVWRAGTRFYSAVGA
jgi:ABC-2 type transport system permease protein